ncbi:MAG: tRNA lysidine(34) synthetase TilS [Pseudomonadota bacterium]
MTEAADRRTERLRSETRRAVVEGRVQDLAVAVSGGSDSLALLDLMHGHAREGDFQLSAVTVDHGLRPEAAAEARHVAAYCSTRGIPHQTLRWSDWDGTGNLQAEAREARYRLIAKWARDRGIGAVALGHTENDVAETFLLRLARGAGIDGLARMQDRFERNGVIWLRPLLGQTRDACRTYLEERGVTWIEDPSNDDPRFDRVKVRQTLAALEPLGIDGPGLARTANHISKARHALEHYAAQEARRLTKFEGGDLLVTRNPVPAVPQEIERRLVVAGIRFVSGAIYPPRSEALNEMFVALNAYGKGTHTLGGCCVTLLRPEGHLNQTLRITREWNAVKTLRTPTTEVWDRWRLEGPHSPALEVRALGHALAECPDWRAQSVPRVSLLASPAVFKGSTLVSAPLAGLKNGWIAQLASGRDDFALFLMDH